MDRDQIVEAAPDAVRTLWMGIEDFADLKLSVEPSSIGRAYYRINRDYGCIGLPPRDEISWSDIAHELMHVRRYWIEKTICLQDATGLHPSVNWLENVLEHIHINPRVEAIIGAKDPQREADVAELASAEFHSDQQRRRDCFAAALLLENGIYDRDQSRVIREKLKAEGVIGLRPAARKTIEAVRRDKVDGAKVACQIVGIPWDALHGRTFDIQNRTIEDFALPS